MNRSELIAFGIATIECVLIGICGHVFNSLLNKRVNKILEEDGSNSIQEYLNKKSKEIHDKESC